MTLYMPAEWHRHEATILTWPHDESIWRGEHARVERCFVEIASRLSAVERVLINVPDAEWEQRVLRLLKSEGATMSAVRMLQVASNDVWARDHGPTMVLERQADEFSRRLMVHWRFNAWGGKYESQLDAQVPERLAELLGWEREVVDLVMEGGALEVNGAGDLLTTESVLLNPNRNPGVGRAQLEQVLSRWLGVRQILWLGDGLLGDDTDGHIDDIARFVDEQTVVVVCPDDPAHPDHAAMQDNIDRLRTYRTHLGRPLRVVRLPMPEPVLFGDEHLPASYANFYIANGLVLVPVFHQPSDGVALSTLSELMPSHDVVGIDCRALVSQYGAIHCVTQQVPALLRQGREPGGR